MADKGSLHQLGDIPGPLPQAVGDLAPAGMSLIAILLGEDGLHDRTDHRLVGFAHARQEVASKMHPAALPPGAENLACSGLQALMGVADHHLHAPQPTAREGARGKSAQKGERGPWPQWGRVSPVNASEGMTVIPRISRRPSVLTATATITAIETVRGQRATGSSAAPNPALAQLHVSGVQP